MTTETTTKKKMGRPKTELEKRFWRCVDKRGPDECWPWIGSTQGEGGYGQLSVDGSKDGIRGAHRISWMLAHGLDKLPPSNVVVRHTCNNKSCVAPHHLVLGTHKDNSEDAVRDGLVAHGEEHYNAVLTEDAVRMIRVQRALGILAKDLAAEYGVTPVTIYHVTKRLTWKHVE